MSPRIHSRTARQVLTTGTAVLALALAGCTPSEQPSSAPPQPGVPGEQQQPGGQSPSPESAAHTSSTSATLSSPGRDGSALTYNPAAPQGARVKADINGSAQQTTVNFEVSGFQPDRGYAVHAHVKPCGPTGDAAGPHFQNRQDPAATPQKPSTDPAFANPRNEIWLDLHTDGQGAGRSTTQVPFGFSDRAPKSIIVHEAMHTSTGPGEAGQAGGRLACVNIKSQ